MRRRSFPSILLVMGATLLGPMSRAEDSATPVRGAAQPGQASVGAAQTKARSGTVEPDLSNAATPEKSGGVAVPPPDTADPGGFPQSLLTSESDLFGTNLPVDEGPPGRATASDLDYDSGYEHISEDAYDVVGGYEGEVTCPANRPLYPYGATNYWYGQDADVESWGDLLELPNVQLGWFASADVSAVKVKADPEFNSGTRLDKVFPGQPVTLGTAYLNWTAIPRVDFGYRFEHGLGEFRGTYRYLTASGTDQLNGFDSGGNGTLHTAVEGHILDLDYAALEFNAEGLPDLPMLMKSPGRFGLGRPTTSNLLCPPLEIRWRFGSRIARMDYESVGKGDFRQESVSSNFVGAGLHFVLELDQKLRTKQPLFLHAKFDGSGMFGYTEQTFRRSEVVPVLGNARGSFRDGLGVPTVMVELGMSWVPKWPERNMRYTVAYLYEEWFSLGQAADSNLDIYMHGIMLRAEHKF